MFKVNKPCLQQHRGKIMKQPSLLLLFTLTMFSQSIFAGKENPQVIIKKFEFIPQEITIKRGQTINWENREKRQYHSVWFEALNLIIFSLIRITNASSRKPEHSPTVAARIRG